MHEDRKLPGLSSHRVGETRATMRVVELEARGAGLVASHHRLRQNVAWHEYDGHFAAPSASSCSSRSGDGRFGGALMRGLCAEPSSGSSP